MPRFTRPPLRTRIIPEFAVKLVRAPLGIRVASNADATRIASRLIGDADRETLLVLFVTTNGRVRGSHVAGIGALDQMSVGPREVFRAAIVGAAAGIILAHNHPSGDGSPSPQDDAFTARIAVMGQAIGIALLDHIIVAPERTGGAFSYFAAGRLPTGNE